MSLFIVDVEADGKAPGLYSMVNFGAVRVDRELKTTFEGFCAPISKKFNPEALAVSGYTREQHEAFPDSKKTMGDFLDWLRQHNEGKMTLVSDNPAFDWSYINYYFVLHFDDNPFGHSARRIGDFCAGLKNRWGASSDFKKLRVTKHTHNPVDDAVGNAEALLALCDQHGVKLPGIDLVKSAPASKPIV